MASKQTENINDEVDRLALGMTVKHVKFAETWLSNGENATSAYQEIYGYEPDEDGGQPHAHRVSGSKILNYERVQAYINARKKQIYSALRLTTDQVHAINSMDAQIDIADILTDEEIIQDARRRGKSRGIKKFKRTVTTSEYGTKIELEVEMIDRRDALKHAAKLMNMEPSSKHEMTGKDGGPITFVGTPEEAAKRVADLISKGLAAVAESTE